MTGRSLAAFRTGPIGEATLDLFVRRSPDRTTGHVVVTEPLSHRAMWSAAMDVGEWLKGIGLDQYEANFRDNKIDAAVLPQLTADDLKDIGVVAVGDRRKLLAAIAALASATPPAGFFASVPKPTPPKGPQVSAERRPITVMFCDLVGSTGLAAKLDPDGATSSIGRFPRKF